MVELCCHTNRKQCPNFNFNEIVHIFNKESFLKALKVDIGAFKDYQATVVPTQLQAKTAESLTESEISSLPASSVTSSVWPPEWSIRPPTPRTSG
jgi:hypothetical protein